MPMGDSKQALENVQKYMMRQGFGEKAAGKYATLGNKLLLDAQLDGTMADDLLDEDSYEAIMAASPKPSPTHVR